MKASQDSETLLKEQLQQSQEQNSKLLQDVKALEKESLFLLMYFKFASHLCIGPFCLNYFAVLVSKQGPSTSY